MADLNASNWSETDGSNNATPPDGWPSVTMLPNQVEPAARAIMGALKRWYDKVTGAYTSTGASTHYIVTPSNNAYPTAYATGDVWNFYAHQDSAGSDDFQISNANGLAAKPIYVMSQAGTVVIGPKQIKAGQFARLEYDATLNAAAGGWLLTNPIPVSLTRFTTINSTGGTVNLTDAQARVDAILITGVLVGNLTLVLPASFPVWSWALNNQTTGAFSVILENNTPVATVTVPQGGLSWASTDGTTMYYGVPTPAQGDSTLRFANTAWVATYFAPLASPALTGVPTTPTAAVGTNTTQIASTAFVQQTAFAAALPAQPGGTTPYVPVSQTGAVSWQPFQNDTANFLAGIV